MTSLELRRVNNYPEWDTVEGINSVIQFIQNQRLSNNNDDLKRNLDIG